MVCCSQTLKSRRWLYALATYCLSCGVLILSLSAPLWTHECQSPGEKQTDTCSFGTVLPGITLISADPSPRKHNKFTQWSFNVGPPSATLLTLKRHWVNLSRFLSQNKHHLLYHSMECFAQYCFFPKYIFLWYMRWRIDNFLFSFFLLVSNPLEICKILFIQ